MADAVVLLVFGSGILVGFVAYEVAAWLREWQARRG